MATSRKGGRTTRQPLPSPAAVFRAIILASKRMPHFFDEALDPLGLNLTEFHVLQTLAKSGPTPMARLGDGALVTRAAVTAIADELEDRGLVRRVRGSGDRRVINVQMTPAGRKLFALARQKHEAVITRFVSLLEPDEVRTLMRCYEKMLKFPDQKSD